MTGLLAKRIASISWLQIRKLSSNAPTFDFVSIKSLIPEYKVLQEECNCYLNKLSETQKLSDPFTQLSFSSDSLKEPKSEIPIYKRHLLLLDSTSNENNRHLTWPSKIEKDTSFPLDIMKTIKDTNMEMTKNNLTLPIMVNALELVKYKNSEPKYEVLSLPEWKIVSFDKNAVKDVVELLNSKISLKNNLDPAIEINDFDGDNLLMVCGHNLRDRRCGLMTSEILSQKSFIQQYNVGIVSHIGGHKFAGNIIMYTRSKVDNATTSVWFRHVTPQVLPTILQELKNGRIVQEFYRGSVRI